MKSRKLIFGILLASVLGISACTIPAWVNTVEADAEVAVPIAASLIGVIDYRRLQVIADGLESSGGAIGIRRSEQQCCRARIGRAHQECSDEDDRDRSRAIADAGDHGNRRALGPAGRPRSSL